MSETEPTIFERFRDCVEAHFHTSHNISYLSSRGLWTLRFQTLGYEIGWHPAHYGSSGESAKVFGDTIEEVLERAIKYIERNAESKRGGWICPHCNTAYAPTVSSCSCHKWKPDNVQ